MSIDVRERTRIRRRVLALRTDKRTAHKVCSKCGKRGWHKPRERFCKQQRFGPRSYACWGKLVPIQKEPIVPIAEQANDRLNAARNIQRGERWRAAAQRKVAVADALIERYRAAAIAAHRREAKMVMLIAKWERKSEQQRKRANMTDAEVQAVYDRAIHAQHVQKVRRRLLGKQPPVAPLEEK